MSINLNDLEILAIPDKVSRIEKSTLKKIDGQYQKNEIDLTTQVENLNDDITLRVKKSDIVDNLNSTDTDKPLSANQGKVLNDKTAKLAVSNVFTQPQQVPNATLPQHVTNLSQVETMFEMFKQQLRGYNFAMPDLTGKTEISAGVYRISQDLNYTLDYDVFNGEWILNGTITETTFINNILGKTFTDLGVNTFTYIYVSGTIGAMSSQWVGWHNPRYTVALDNTNFYSITSTNSVSNIISIGVYNGDVYTNLRFKIQLEKGSTATPYTVPGQIPQYKIVGEA